MDPSVPCYVKASITRSLERPLPYQNPIMSLPLPYGIGKQLHDPVILPENEYNMEKMGVMLSMLSSLKVLKGKGELRNYRGAGVKRTTVTTIGCISADDRSLFQRIIWPATTH